MGRKIKKIGNEEYLYVREWNPLTKRREERYIGNVKNIPKIVDSSQSENESLSQSDIESMYQEFYKALECDNIDAVLVEIVNACLDSYLEKMKSHFPPEAIKSSQWKARIQVLEEIKAYIKYHGVPPALVEVLREMLVRWRKAPAYAVIEEDEIKNTD